MTETEKFRDLLGKFDTATLVTRAPDGSLRARPMVIAGVDENCDVWFITNRDSAKVDEIERDAHVQVVCQDGWSSCVCVSGRATPDFDRARIRDVWKPVFQAWFSLGVNDPDIVLIHVAGERGEYWDNSGANEFNYMYQTIKSFVTGDTPHFIEGEMHGRVHLPRR